MTKRLAVVAAVLLSACVADVDGWKDLQTSTRVSDGASIQHARVCAPGDEMTCHARVVVDGALEPLASSGPSGLTPADLRAAYNISGAGNSSTIIAIVDAYGYPTAESDLAVYRSQFGLPACTTANGCFIKLDQRGGTAYPRADVGWDQEQALDLDMASAMCPNCKIMLVQADTATTTNLGTAVNTAVARGAHVVSNSYGGSEQGAASADAYFTHPGVAITVSSGDNGYGVEYPASSPHVTAVGGTSLVKSASARGWTETVWNGAGSGCSTVFAKPSWQKDQGCAKRTVADAAAVADPATGVAVYGPARRNRSAWMVFGGTSVAAPVIGGVYAVNGGTVGDGAQDVYAHLSSLYDVTSGSNGSCGSYLCTGGTGYDGPTGLGTPNGSSAF